MFASSLCLQLEHEKLKLLLARGYNFKPGLSEVGDCYRSAIVKTSLIMSQVLLEYSDNRGKQYFSELLSETIERVSNLVSVTEHRPIEGVKFTRATHSPGEESFELNNKERNEILTLYYSKKFDAFFNRIFAFKHYDSTFLEVVNKRLCLDRTYDYFPKFLSSQLVKRNGMYEIFLCHVLPTCWKGQSMSGFFIL
ncbi:hypothetical protein [Pseudoalteromonas rubra]|uniref:hypothetical protein n=1 Tax=Pseudoalteromonas rubra TaxID=43658 RepID=UPI0013DDD518|nr:hypothetical protein [Pseudoalteromonas rubra]